MLRQEVVLTYDFHARPSTHLVNQAMKFKSDIKILLGDHEANAKSILSIMTLELVIGDTIQIETSGIDEEEAMKKLVHIIEVPQEEDW
ncbi:HPr family phosphocarrier protein [Vallitalea okinawensis]|uniref:HPr family phosphocarrier protein n=1 Tax=Vallitalea okinawensis TaxID=2078660 RepID=UPI000CFDD2C5|nr:HPr family phosphocarrier protein [Vallitalea okinawensis]